MLRTTRFLLVLLVLAGCTEKAPVKNAEAPPSPVAGEGDVRETYSPELEDLSDSHGDKPPLRISVSSGRPEYEAGQRVHLTLTLANVSTQVVALPSFRFMNRKGQAPEVAFYMKKQILRIQIRHGREVVPIKKEWLAIAKSSRPFSAIDLQPGETIRVPLTLNQNWYPAFYSLTTPGAYTVTVRLDTTQADAPGILKGRFTSKPATFRIIPAREFRAQEAGESQHDYTVAKVMFYLGRIARRDGEYFSNVHSILRVKEGVPALTEALNSEDEERAHLARSILGQIHHRSRNADTIVLPEGQDEWMEWWQTEGRQLPQNTLWSNFDSYYQ